MDRYKFRAYCREFPVVSHLVEDAKDVDNIQVKRLDESNLTTIKGDRGDFGNSLFTRYWDTQVIVVADCLRTYKLAQTKTEGTWGVAHQPDARPDGKGETLAEWCLEHLDCLDCVLYVIEDATWENSGSISDAGRGRKITIYKPPKAEKLAQIVYRYIEQAKVEVETECNF